MRSAFDFFRAFKVCLSAFTILAAGREKQIDTLEYFISANQ